MKIKGGIDRASPDGGDDMPNYAVYPGSADPRKTACIEIISDRHKRLGRKTKLKKKTTNQRLQNRISTLGDQKKEDLNE